MNVGIDLLWVRPKKVGGTESYIRNLLDGFFEYSDNSINFYLFVSKDNKNTFLKYYKRNNFKEVICNVDSSSIYKRILWENLYLDKIANRYNIDIMFIPVYSKPIFCKGNIKYITVIHDLQALHYPEYFSIIKRLWLKYSWKNTVKSSYKIIAISDFVKNDIIEKFNLNIDESKKIEVIYNPITNLENFEDFKIIEKKYKIEKKKYFYTVSSMLPHKNLITLLYLIKEIKNKYPLLPQKLVISGIGGKSKKEIHKLITSLDLNQNVIITGFIDNKTRNTLYKNSFIFLFPSIFEGFGMPPVEALKLGVPTITTKKTSLYEVTQGKALYVNDPFDVKEWIIKIIEAQKLSKNSDLLFEEYSLKNVTEKYLKIFKESL